MVWPNYYPYGKTLRAFTSTPSEKFLTTQHERDQETGLDYRGARFYDADVGRFLSLDPLASEYPSLSDYSYVAGNPIVFIDPTGMAVESTIVTDNGDGTYKVIGGNTNDGNNGVYVVELVDGEYQFTGEIIGTTLTYDSFYNYDDGEWHGTINLNINDPKADEGRAFLKDEIIDADIGLAEYISKAKGGEELDFKARGLEDQDITKDFTKVDYYYRGYSVGKETHFGAYTLPVIASARDIGNYAAGYVAGNHMVPWSWARYAFDGLESCQKGRLATEGQGTQAAQQKGHRDAWNTNFTINPSMW